MSETKEDLKRKTDSLRPFVTKTALYGDSHIFTCSNPDAVLKELQGKETALLDLINKLRGICFLGKMKLTNDEGHIDSLTLAQFQNYVHFTLDQENTRAAFIYTAISNSVEPERSRFLMMVLDALTRLTGLSHPIDLAAVAFHILIKNAKKKEELPFGVKIEVKGGSSIFQAVALPSTLSPTSSREEDIEKLVVYVPFLERFYKLGDFVDSIAQMMAKDGISKDKLHITLINPDSKWLDHSAFEKEYNTVFQTVESMFKKAVKSSELPETVNPKKMSAFLCLKYFESLITNEQERANHIETLLEILKKMDNASKNTFFQDEEYSDDEGPTRMGMAAALFYWSRTALFKQPQQDKTQIQKMKALSKAYQLLSECSKVEQENKLHGYLSKNVLITLGHFLSKNLENAKSGAATLDISFVSQEVREKALKALEESRKKGADTKDGKDAGEAKGKEGKDSKDNKEGKEAKETTDGKEIKAGKDTHSVSASVSTMIMSATGKQASGASGTSSMSSAFGVSTAASGTGAGAVNEVAVVAGTAAASSSTQSTSTTATTSTSMKAN